MIRKLVNVKAVLR